MLVRTLLLIVLNFILSCTVASVDFSNSQFNNLQLKFSKIETGSENFKINLNQTHTVTYQTDDSSQSPLKILVSYSVENPQGYTVEQILADFENEIILDPLTKSFSLNFKVKSELPFTQESKVIVTLKSEDNSIVFTPAQITLDIDASPFVTLSASENYINSINQGAISFSGSCSFEGSSINLEIDGSGTGLPTTLCTNGQWSQSLDLSPLGESNHQFKAAMNLSEGKFVYSTVNTLMKDITPPDVSSVVVTDGLYYNQADKSPIITWSGGTDTLSGIDKYEISLGTAPGISDILSWQTPLNIGFHQVMNLSLVDGAYYYANIRIVDKAGNTSSQVSSDGWRTDLSPPSLPNNLNDGILNFSANKSPILSWNASVDPAVNGSSSGLNYYEMAIGDNSGGNNILDWVNIGNVTSRFFDSLSLSGNTRYYTSIRAIDNAGNASQAVLGDGWWNLGINKFAIDNTTPIPRSASSYADFGKSVAISEDESTLVVGVPNDNLDTNGGNYVANAGAVFVYLKSGGNWVFQQKLIPTGSNARNSYDEFGISVAISGDTIVVGAKNQSYNEVGANYLYRAGAAFIFKRSGGVWSQQQKIIPSGANARNSYDEFGTFVAIETTTIAIGAPHHGYDDSGANYILDAGAAYVFTEVGGIWTQQQKIAPSGVNSRIGGDLFGSSMDLSGDTLAISSPFQDYDASGSGFLSDAGAAFVFTRSVATWSQQQKIVPSGANARMGGDNFASSISIHMDTIAVGANHHDYDSAGAASKTDAGAAFIFTRSGGVWSQQQKIVPSGANARNSYDAFGNSIAIQNDVLIIGADHQNYDEFGSNLKYYAGAAFVFTRSGVTWSQQQKIVPSGANARMEFDYFSYSIALSSNTLFIGAISQDYDELGNNFIEGTGAAFVFSFSAGTWSLNQKIVDNVIIPQNRIDLVNANYGYSHQLALSEDGQTLVIGAPNDSTNESNTGYIPEAGSVSIYIKSGTGWLLQQKIIATGTNARNSGDNFGASVAISGDTLAVSAVNHDYDSSGTNFIINTGAVFIYKRNAGVWTLLQKVTPTGTSNRMSSDSFGKSLSLHLNTLVVGVPYHSYNEVGANYVGYSGAVFIYYWNGSLWEQQQKIVPSGTNARMSSDYFGGEVSIYGDTLAVTSYYHDYDEFGSNYLDGAGAVFVFTRSGSIWSQQQKIIPTGTNARMAYDSFGFGLSLFEDTLAVGAPDHDYDEFGSNYLDGAGTVFMFTRSGSLWSQQQKIVPSGTNARGAYNGFGNSVSLSSNTLAIGSPKQGYDGDGTNLKSYAGACFIFNKSTGTWLQERKLVPTGTNARNISDYFGFSVVASENGAADGFTFVIGSPFHNYDSTGANPVSNSGAVFTFH